MAHYGRRRRRSSLPSGRPSDRVSATPSERRTPEANCYYSSSDAAFRRPLRGAGDVTTTCARDGSPSREAGASTRAAPAIAVRLVTSASSGSAARAPRSGSTPVIPPALERSARRRSSSRDGGRGGLTLAGRPRGASVRARSR
jgi:hypothetical protein